MTTRRSFLKTASGLAVAAATRPAFANTEITKKNAPNVLREGATIGLVSPATTVSYEAIEWAKENVLKLGFNYKLGRNAHRQYGYFAGTDEQRAADINAMFADKNVDAIWCLKGGWGCARILDLLDFDLIRANPKIIIGYSDITSLLNAINSQTNMMTFHGPNAIYGESEYSEKYLFDILMNRENTVIYNHEDAEVKTITGGKAKGALVGGNLTVITSIIGSPYLPSFKNKILFLEDVSEPAYKVDRMMTQLTISGLLSQVKGVVFGTCSKCVGSEEAFTVEQIIHQHLKPLNVPAFSGASIGHILHKMTLPIGGQVIIDADSFTIEVENELLA